MGTVSRARGKLALLDGDPGVGKSLITIDLAARLSRATPLPNGTVPDRSHATLLLSAEDDAGTIRARAEAAGADLDRLVAVCAPSGSFALTDLEGLIRAYSAGLVVIDPIMAFLPRSAAANLDQSVRRALNPLAVVAGRTDCAVLLVRHLRKSESAKAVLRGQGSMGIIAAARTGLLAAKHPTEPALGVLAVAKSNVADCAPSLGYRVKTDEMNRPVVDWLGPAALSADALGQTCVSGSREQAAEWLRAELAHGPRPAVELLTAADAMCIPSATLYRAKSELGICSHHVVNTGANVWYWYDPAAPWPADAPFPNPGASDRG